MKTINKKLLLLFFWLENTQMLHKSCPKEIQVETDPLIISVERKMSLHWVKSTWSLPGNSNLLSGAKATWLSHPVNLRCQQVKLSLIFLPTLFGRFAWVFFLWWKKKKKKLQIRLKQSVLIRNCYNIVVRSISSYKKNVG